VFCALIVCSAKSLTSTAPCPGAFHFESSKACASAATLSAIASTPGAAADNLPLTPALGDLFLRPYSILIAMSKPVSPRLLAATNLNEVV
jgi:hypothetical protein